MFILTLHDRNGVELKEGDIVRISSGARWSFFSEVKYLKEQGAIAPFHTFSFHSFEKVDRLPENATESASGDGYKCWYISNPEAEDDKEASTAERYLIDWRCCEYLLEKKNFRIKQLQSEEK